MSILNSLQVKYGLNYMDRFGASIAIAPNGSGYMAVIGACGFEGSKGKVYVYCHDGIAWTDITPKTGMVGEVDCSRLGQSIAIATNGSDHVVIVGAPSCNDDRGKVYVYRYDGIEWSDITPTVDVLGDTNQFGCSVSIASNGADYIAVIGAFGFNGRKDRVYAYRYDGIAWTDITPDSGVLKDRDCGWFGKSVSVTHSRFGYMAVIGAPGFYGNKGKAYIYHYDGIAWTDVTPEGILQGMAANDRFGYSVDIASNDSSCVAIIGAHYHDGGKGKISVYQYDGIEWSDITPTATLLGAATSDALGYSVAITSTGKDYIATAGAFGCNNNKGKAYIYHHDGATWTNLTPETTMAGKDEGDWFGYSVATAANGADYIVGVGVHGYNNGTGKVCIYK